MTIMCYSHVLLSNKSCHWAENNHSRVTCPVTDTGIHPGLMNLPQTAKDTTQRNTLTSSRNQLSNENTHEEERCASITTYSCHSWDKTMYATGWRQTWTDEGHAIKCRLLLWSKHLTLTGRVGWSITFGQSSNEEWSRRSRKHLFITCHS